jgi:CRISPR/Cas system Type II protein with McrA/HNH and RuvC-like nuclease domain
MKTNSIEKEIEGYNADKKEIENILNSSIISYAEEIKKNGGDILKELSNPQLNQSIKHNKKYTFYIQKGRCYYGKKQTYRRLSRNRYSPHHRRQKRTPQGKRIP